MSRGLIEGLGTRLSRPLPPRSASSPGPAVSLALCTRPQHPSIVAPRIARRCRSEDSRPDDQVRIRAFIFERNEHDALSRARHLADENEPRNGEAATIRCFLYDTARREALPREGFAKERERMRAKA